MVAISLVISHQSGEAWLRVNCKLHATGASVRGQPAGKDEVWFALPRPACIVPALNKFRTILTLLMALLWLPATVHCRLESLPGIEFLSCCLHNDAESEKAPAHQDNDCQTDACATVESGLYKQEDAPSDGFVKPFKALADSVCSVGAEMPAITCVGFPSSSAPPELSVLWRFSHRTALPPRAPSPTC